MIRIPASTDTPALESTILTRLLIPRGLPKAASSSYGWTIGIASRSSTRQEIRLFYGGTSSMRLSEVTIP
ncbi:uncharacterized protein K444DRAFT_622313 [Hyaloscypha bicolor E]|uniref:Uncharacterized protein n=1 Tax=Hyaloscypha bicolor E TaxID=1095630 RepID=A0A2J6SFX6_9HELO|nr:uncharacterized protein K444DRAFT_622313 [Hyaloscypha bicolor E]PMD49663.1 hypothetical protein K444DRAFT_622313 [Hyaloscypha bicolor E]